MIPVCGTTPVAVPDAPPAPGMAGAADINTSFEELHIEESGDILVHYQPTADNLLGGQLQHEVATNELYHHS